MDPLVHDMPTSKRSRYLAGEAEGSGHDRPADMPLEVVKATACASLTVHSLPGKRAAAEGPIQVEHRLYLPLFHLRSYIA